MTTNRIIILTGDLAEDHGKPAKWKDFSDLPDALIEVAGCSFSDQSIRRQPILNVHVELVNLEELPWLLEKKYFTPESSSLSAEIRTYLKTQLTEDPLMVFQVASKKITIKDINYVSHEGPASEVPLSATLEFSDPGMRAHRITGQGTSTTEISTFNWKQFLQE